MNLEQAYQTVKENQNVIGTTNKSGDRVYGLFIGPTDEERIGKYLQEINKIRDHVAVSVMLGVNDYSVYALLTDIKTHVLIYSELETHKQKP